MDLTEKVILVTGANRGIGKSISLRLASMGARVAVTGRNMAMLDKVVKEINETGGISKGFKLDVAIDNQAHNVTKNILDIWGQIDVLINNAGVYMYETPVWKTSVEQWDYVMNTNLRGLFLTCNAVIPHMMERNQGHIVNIGSSSGKVADDEEGKSGSGPYSASKFGVVGYTMSLAKSLYPYGIKVNGVNPGWVDTDMTRNEIPAGGSDWIKPEEIADAVGYLLTQTPYVMSGQFIDIF